MKDDVEAAIERCNALIGSGRCRRAVVLIDKDLLAEHPNVNYDNIDLLSVSGYWDARALRTFAL